jgi:drug/metabolite transporter (DMT)-like permease
MILIFSGVILVSMSWSSLRKHNYDRLVAGAKEAIIAMVFFGIGALLLRFANDMLGSIWSLVFIRYFAAFFLFSFGKATKKSFQLTGGQIWIILIFISMLDLLSFIGFNVAISTELVSIVTPIVSSSPAVTFILAYLFLKERLEKNQYLGLPVLFTGLIIISVT